MNNCSYRLQLVLCEISSFVVFLQNIIICILLLCSVVCCLHYYYIICHISFVCPLVAYIAIIDRSPSLSFFSLSFSLHS